MSVGQFMQKMLNILNISNILNIAVPLTLCQLIFFPVSDASVIDFFLLDQFLFFLDDRTA